MLRECALALGILSCASGTRAPVAARSPNPIPSPTPKGVKETMHGVVILDPYRWLEQEDSPQSREFVAQQNAATRNALDAIPERAAIHARLAELLSIGMVSAPQPTHKGTDKRYFYTRRDGQQNQPVLYVREGLRGSDRPVIDPNTRAEDGTVSLDWWVPSHNGRYVAYGLSQGGTEDSTLRVVDVDQGEDVSTENVPHARWANVAWKPDHESFYYARLPKPGTVPDGEELYHRRIYFRKMRMVPESAEHLVFEPKDMRHWPVPQLSPDGRWLVVTVFQGWSKSEVYLADTHKSDVAFDPIVSGVDALYEVIPLNDRLLVRTNENAPRFRVISIDPKQPGRESWREIISEGNDVLDSMVVARKHIYATYLTSARSRVSVFSLNGNATEALELPSMGTVDSITGEWDGDEAFLAFQSFAVAPTILRHNGKSPTLDLWTRVEAALDSSPYAIEQARYSSKDGTTVTMFLVYRAPLVRNGGTPTLLSGYGGFSISLTPRFSRSLYLFLERGGVVAVPNLRGGGEYGEDWHRAGMLEQKQNVFDDFVFAARWLIDQKITSPGKLAISGRSNGGLLIGAAITQAPELFRAAVCGVPLLDMLRYHHFQIGKLWIPEYGSAEDPTAFAWLHAYSPYHHVTDGTPYPAVLLTTAEGDTRVDPMHARKMTARLQAATSSNQPVLLRVESKAGHGMGKPLSMQIEESTDEWTFLLRQLGMTP